MWNWGIGTDSGGDSDKHGAEVGARGRAAAGDGTAARDCGWFRRSMRPHAIATCHSWMLHVKSEMVLLFIWHGTLSLALRMLNTASQYGRGDVGSLEQVAREWPRVIMLPVKQRNSVGG